MGAYTSNSKGYPYVRNKIAQFISERDNVDADPDKIYCTNGASEGARLILNMLIRNNQDGVLIPIP